MLKDVLSTSSDFPLLALRVWAKKTTESKIRMEYRLKHYIHWIKKKTNWVSLRRFFHYSYCCWSCWCQVIWVNGLLSFFFIFEYWNFQHTSIKFYFRLYILFFFTKNSKYLRCSFWGLEDEERIEKKNIEIRSWNMRHYTILLWNNKIYTIK